MIQIAKILELREKIMQKKFHIVASGCKLLNAPARYFNSCSKLNTKDGSQSSLPDLVKSRTTMEGIDSSTIPDTDSNSLENEVNRLYAEKMRSIHDAANVSYTVVESTGEKIPDWSPKQIEELGKEFYKHESEQESQILFDSTYSDITRAYANSKTLAETDKSNEISVGRVLLEEAIGKCKTQERLEELKVRREEELEEIEARYNKMSEENMDYYNKAKEQLLSAAQLSSFSIETKGHDEEYYQIQEELNRPNDSPIPGPSNYKPFKQDSSDIEKDDFSSFDPFDD